MNTARRALVAGTAVALASGCEVARVTQVELTLAANTPPSDGTFYEVFATVGGSAVSLARFEVRVVDERVGIDITAAIKAAIDPVNPSVIYGHVDGLSVAGQPIGGLSFDVPIDLTDAVDLFITREALGDTDPVPSRDAIAECPLTPGGRGTLACVLRRPGDKTLVVGTAALVLPVE
jgi:hypothetical protein